MAITDEERKEWAAGATYADNVTDVLTVLMKEDANAEAAAYMAVDMVLRPYLNWLHSAQVLGRDPESVRSSLIYLICNMVMEMAHRMKGRTTEGDTIATEQWLSEFVTDLGAEMVEDLKVMASKSN